MIHEFGHYVYCSTFIIAAVERFFYVFKKRFSFSTSYLRTDFWTCLYMFCITTGFFCTVCSFLESDFSVLTVFSTSNQRSPLLYNVSAIWSNHEGSMLLWHGMLAVCLLWMCTHTPQPILARNFLWSSNTFRSGNPFSLVAWKTFFRNVVFQVPPSTSFPRTWFNGMLPKGCKTSSLPPKGEGAFALLSNGRLLGSKHLFESVSPKTTLQHLLVSNRCTALTFLCFFSLFGCMTSNAFLRVPFLCTHAFAELNPVLQDPVLAIHPPCVYGGYVCSAICFCLCSCIATMNFPKQSERAMQQRADWCVNVCTSSHATSFSDIWMDFKQETLRGLLFASKSFPRVFREGCAPQGAHASRPLGEVIRFDSLASSSGKHHPVRGSPFREPFISDKHLVEDDALSTDLLAQRMRFRKLPSVYELDVHWQLRAWSHAVWWFVRQWMVRCWCLLTLGIFLGSWWAYHELGWGGWWFWDPVENAVLVPWLLASAGIHCLLERGLKTHTGLLVQPFFETGNQPVLRIKEEKRKFFPLSNEYSFGKASPGQDFPPLEQPSALLLRESLPKQADAKHPFSLWTPSPATMFVCQFTFLSCMLGTFLIRSGLLASVHSFANDSSRGVLLIVFVAIYFMRYVCFVGSSLLVKDFGSNLFLALIKPLCGVFWSSNSSARDNALGGQFALKAPWKTLLSDQPSTAVIRQNGPNASFKGGLIAETVLETKLPCRTRTSRIKRSSTSYWFDVQAILLVSMCIIIYGGSFAPMLDSLRKAAFASVVGVLNFDEGSGTLIVGAPFFNAMIVPLSCGLIMLLAVFLLERLLERCLPREHTKRQDLTKTAPKPQRNVFQAFVSRWNENPIRVVSKQLVHVFKHDTQAPAGRLGPVSVSKFLRASCRRVVFQTDLCRWLLFFFCIHFCVLFLVSFCLRESPLTSIDQPFFLLESLTLCICWMLSVLLIANSRGIAGTLAHASLSVFSVGILFSNARSHVKWPLTLGNEYALDAQTSFCLRSIDELYGPTFQSICGNMIFRLGPSQKAGVLPDWNVYVAPYNSHQLGWWTLFAEKRFYASASADTVATKVAVHTNLLTDIYALIGAGNAHSGWSITVMKMPYMGCIWLAMFAAFLAGVTRVRVSPTASRVCWA